MAEIDELVRFRAACCGGGGGGEGEIEEMGFAKELKLGQVPRLRCSEAVRDGFEAEKTASQREQRSLTALGRPVSLLWTNMGSRWAQYQAPFPLMALVRTITRPSYLFWMAFAVNSSAETDSTVAFVAADIAVRTKLKKKIKNFREKLKLYSILQFEFDLFSKESWDSGGVLNLPGEIHRRWPDLDFPANFHKETILKSVSVNGSFKRRR